MADTPSGKVALYPPSGGQQPTHFLKSTVEQKLADGWKEKPTVAKAPATKPARADSDKPKQTTQGPDKE